MPPHEIARMIYAKKSKNEVYFNGNNTIKRRCKKEESTMYKKTVWRLFFLLCFIGFLVACNEESDVAGVSSPNLPGGQGDPFIQFTYIPPVGSFNNLEGRVLHVYPSEYRVAVFIYVSGWWNKPTFANPLTSIGSDGSWVTDITTGGIDEKASRIAAFLVPATYNPPVLSGDNTFPAELEQNATAKVEVNRGP